MSPPSESSVRVGHAIDVVRRQRGYESKELAALAGVSVSSISRWQNGRVEMSLADLETIAAALRTPISLLLEPPADDDDLRIAVVAADAARKAARGGEPEPS